MSRARSLLAVAVSALIVVWAAPPAWGQDPIESLETQIKDSRQRLAQIRAEKQRLRSEMTALAAQVHDVTAELDNLNQQATNQEALLRELDRQLAIRDQRVTAVTADLLRTQDELVEKKVLFARRARDLYKRGPLAEIQVILAAESFGDLINRYQYLYLVALHDRLLVSQIEELKDRLQEQWEQLRREVQGLREGRQDKVGELQDLHFLEQARRRRLQAMRGLQTTTRRRLEKLEDDESQLANLVERLEREREAAEALAATAPTAGTLTPSVRGSLDWPAEGRLIYRFGRQRYQDGTVLLRNGIGIAAAESTPVKAVSTGTVVFAQPYLSYGPSVILSHGGGYYSLYLYLSEILVPEGATVVSGQTLGRVGGANTPEGAHVEFQIRERGRPVDPLPWLRNVRG